MTALFVSHGAPTVALAPGAAGQALSAWASGRDKPSAVLVVSAHWDSAAPCLGTADQPETLYDFWGFPEALYDLVYPARGAPQLAVAAQQLLDRAGLPASLDPRRGLDHGAWIPLRILYPEADVPVTALSIQSALGPHHHYRLGQALAPLAAQGVLILGSGSLTHNLRHYRREDVEPAYVGQFQEWIRERLVAQDVASLLAYRELAPGAVEAHPSEEHLLPLMVCLGAAGTEFKVQRLYGGVYDAAIAMDSYVFSGVA